MRALITRPLEDAKPLAECVKQRGIEPVLAPLISIAPLQTTLPDLSAAQALLFTSANGVRSFARLSAVRSCRVLTVGNATAETARAFGFTQVFSASGNAVSLAAMACRLLDPKAGSLYHIAGQTQAGDLAADLIESGFTVARLELYRTQAAESLPAEVAAGFRQNKLELALFYSPHTAEIFTRLIAAADLTSHMASVTALCLSQAVADAAGLPFAAKKIAEHPDQESLLNLLPAPDKSRTPTAPVAPEKPDAPLEPGVARAKPAKAAAASAAARGSPIGAVVGGLAGGSIGAGLIVAIGIASAPLWLEQLSLDPSDSAIAARIDKLERDQAAMPQRVETEIANSPLAIADPTPRLEALERELTALRDRLAAPVAATAELPVEWRRRLDKLEQAMRNVADANGLAAITERVGRLSQATVQFEERLSRAEQGVERSGEQMARQAAFAIAAAHLADATRSNQPFPALLASLRALARNDGDILAALEPLNGAAFHGVARQAEITLAFSDAARKAKAADLAEGSSGWLAEIQRFLGALVTVRRTTADDGASDVDRRLAQAASRLDNGDLAAALAELEDLPRQASLAIDPWRQQARQRVELDRAVQTITGRALAALAKSGS